MSVSVGFNVDPNPVAKTCELHGEYESRNVFGSIWSKCPECSRVAAENQRIAEEAAKRAKDLAIYQRKLGETGIPQRFHNRYLETFVATNEGQRKALGFATSYANDFAKVLASGRSAIFCGRPGTGKTHLAAGIGLKVMQDSRTVLFMTVMRAIRKVKDTWSKASEESESQAIASLALPDLLILDEIGMQFGSETEKLILFDVINERYEKRKPTLLLSNLTASEIKNYLGERIFDRLREDGGECVVFDWESHRTKLQNGQ